MRRLLLLAGLLTACAAADGAAQGQVKGPAMPYPPREAERGISPPLLGRYQPEKTANADAVAEASQVLVGKAAVAVRPNPVAFMRTTTAPDPFEHRNLVRLPGPVPEEPAPPLLLPRK